MGDGDAAPYREQADRACVRAHAAAARVPFEEHAGTLTAEEAQARIESLGRRFVGDMEALKPPSELRARHDALLRVLHRRSLSVLRRPPTGDG